MRRNKPQQNEQKNPRWSAEPQTFTSRELRAGVELLREMLAEIEGACQRMDERQISSVTLAAGQPAEPLTC